MNKYLETFLTVLIFVLCFALAILPVILGLIFNLDAWWTVTMVISIPTAWTLADYLTDKLTYG